MKLNLDKIMNIKTKEDLKKFSIDKPIFYDNYLFHYLIMLDKFDILKMEKFPIYQFNEEGLDGFMLAAKTENYKILKYLIKQYPEYAQNHNNDNLGFINFIEKPSIIIDLMKEFPNIDWYYILKFKDTKSMEFYKFLISKLNFSELKWFMENFEDSKRFPRYYLLSAILQNEIIKYDDKIKILDKIPQDDINKKDIENNGLIVDVIDLEDVDMCKYLLSRNIDLEYIIKPITTFITPFFYLYSKLILMATQNLIKITELIWDKVKSKLDFLFISKEGIDYIGLVLGVDNIQEVSLINKINDFLLKNCPDSSFYRVTSDKITNLFLLIDKPFDKYHKYIENRVLDLTVKNSEGNTVLDLCNEKWKELLLNSKKYKADFFKVKLETNKYQHFTKFTATLIDIIIYFIHLDKKYKNLYIPKLLFENQERKDFSWFVNYNQVDNILDIHPNLNYLINNIRREKSHDYALIFLSLILENDLKHANILIYDFNRLTIERFEPYGDNGIDEIYDDLLEEELTWNTGFKYLRPKDFLTKPGYQLISNENSDNLKAGDFGGFCLGWCLWYIEHRLKNSKIDPKILNQKTIEKLLRLDDSFTEYIRNYSNKLFDIKLKIVKKICFDGQCIREKNISNLYISREDENKIIKFAESYFTSK
jgi:hypothetical protein